MHHPGLQWLRIARWLLVGAAISLSAYWTLTYTGPYRWLNELQRRVLDEPLPMVSFCLSVLLLLIPLIFLNQAISDQVVGQLGSSAAEAWQARQRQAQVRLAQHVNAILRRHLAGVFGIACVLIGGGYGLATFWQGASAGQLQPVSWESIRAGGGPAGALVAIAALPDRRHYLSADAPWRGTPEGRIWLVPLRPGREDEAVRIHLIGEFRDHRQLLALPQDQPVALQGILRRGVDGQAAYRLAQMGIRLGEPCWSLDIDANPGELQSMGQAFMIAFGLLGAAFLALDAWLDRRRRRQEPARS